jgi:hypothetical protein
MNNNITSSLTKRLKDATILYESEHAYTTMGKHWPDKETSHYSFQALGRKGLEISVLCSW